MCFTSHRSPATFVSISTSPQPFVFIPADSMGSLPSLFPCISILKHLLIFQYYILITYCYWVLVSDSWHRREQHPFPFRSNSRCRKEPRGVSADWRWEGHLAHTTSHQNPFRYIMEQAANPGLSGKWPIKWRVFVYSHVLNYIGTSV